MTHLSSPENDIHETLLNIGTCTPHENSMQNQTKMQKISAEAYIKRMNTRKRKKKKYDEAK